MLGIHVVTTGFRWHPKVSSLPCLSTVVGLRCGALAAAILFGSGAFVTTVQANEALQTPTLKQTQICLLANNAAEDTPATQLLNVELARNNAERSQGLMMRENLAADAGMLFVYPYTATRSFWMYRTLIPLDIAFIDADGVIVNIQHMQPCRSYWANRCPNYPAAAPFLYALEVNLGHFAHWQVNVGDQVTAADCETPLAIHTPH